MFDSNALNDTLHNNSAQLGSDPIERLRRQAKQRFIGAAVLVLIAVAALPFLLDSQPRPLSNTVTIDIPKIETKLEAITPATEPAEKPKAPLAFAPPTETELPVAVVAPAVSTAKSNYIVQAGSFSDTDKLQATASRLDKAGIKHYTQAALGKDGTPRTRLRLQGSFATKEEANAAAAQVAKLGIPVIVLKP